MAKFAPEVYFKPNMYKIREVILKIWKNDSLFGKNIYKKSVFNVLLINGSNVSDNICVENGFQDSSTVKKLLEHNK